MPRSSGTTNHAPYASAPAVGLAGDSYYNSASKVLYLADGTVWNPLSVPAGGGTGQALAKNSTSDFDTSWQTVGGAALVASVTAAGPFNVAATSFAAAANFSGVSVNVTPVAGHYYRIRAIIPQITGGVTGNAVYLQLSKDNVAYGQQFGYQAYLTGVMRGFASPVEYVGTLGSPGVSTTFSVRGWSSQASSGAVACEGGQGVFMTIEDFGPQLTQSSSLPVLPPGGTTGQSLTKNSGTDFDVVWGGASPLGLIGFSAVTDGVNRTATSFGTGTDQGTISNITIVTGRRYRIRVFWPNIAASFSAGNGALQAGISRSGTQHGDTVGGRSGVSGFGVSPVIAEWTGSYTAGTYNFGWRIWCGASVTGVVTAGTIITTVEDLGALV
jgi:hypothetical protein